MNEIDLWRGLTGVSVAIILFWCVFHRRDPVTHSYWLCEGGDDQMFVVTIDERIGMPPQLTNFHMGPFVSIEEAKIAAERMNAGIEYYDDEGDYDDEYLENRFEDGED